ncbi:hypothetical protein RND81_04G101200 [Saponaria officinalis]|uniref:Protein XRI1 n=1 Tax=Saponaria officinalis TaxID=3572 RepID=A0AAW1LJS3_SAPOF
MDYLHNDNHSWVWQGCELFLQADSNIDDISYMFEETTPIKSSGLSDYHFDDSEILSKTPQVDKEYSPPSKRRRVLDFNTDSEEISSSFLKSKEKIDALDVGLTELDAYLQEDFYPPAFVDIGPSETWLTECFNSTDMTISSDDGTTSVSSNVQISNFMSADGNNTAPDSASSTLQRPVRSSRNVIFKGRKTYMRTPTKAPSSVTYPFEFIKPSSIHGYTTLKDINQRLHTPPPSKPKEENEFPTSAFSGKPVVGKTKIPTRGNGSITIMRTKG